MSHPREHYEAVAATWLEAFAQRGGKPNLAIVAKWDVPYSTAARWVRRARYLGVLDHQFKRVHACPGCGQQIECARGESPLSAGGTE